MAVADVKIDDKYRADRGRVFISGNQALVRLAIMQRCRDNSSGLNTAGFISGYRGSPLGLLDQSLWQAREFLDTHHLHFEPGVNEDLAATAVWGSQQTNLFSGARYDGVFAMWYGKGPGVDRSGDVFRHANMAGTSPNGGVLALAGDDHGAASSTTAHQSEHGFISAMMPILHPTNVQEIVDLGLLGFSMSRYSGLWVGHKLVTQTVESSASIDISPERLTINIPDDFEMPMGGLHIRWPDDRLAQEERLIKYKLNAALAFVRANDVDRTAIRGEKPRFGIITAGKSYLDVCQSLSDLGINEPVAKEIGLSVYKVGMVWPLEPEGLLDFSKGLEEILVVEEKRPIIENQVKDLLYNLHTESRPRVVGKTDETGQFLLPSSGELTTEQIARIVAKRIEAFYSSDTIHQYLALIAAKEESLHNRPPHLTRTPYFCSGCPHNTSTRIPSGSKALGGIGCHFMALSMDRDTETFTHMGGEGASWIGLSPFTDIPHVFANIGDGTYYHSGLLAIRAAVSANTNITYKILYNDAVAMTGGQPVEGGLSVAAITHQIRAEGVGRIAVVTDEPNKYPANTEFASDVTIHHRNDLNDIQKTLRKQVGVSALIYDQTCAAEKRRRRKRNTLPTPPKRAFINDTVCEGCGDCSWQSNCLSIEPLETEFGRKRAINQSSCNRDFSCVKGFCPSFVTVHGGNLAKPSLQIDVTQNGPNQSLPLPKEITQAEPYNILITGIGGTGVVTIGQIVGMAAHLEGKSCSVLDFTGLAQKGGSVLSHIRVASNPSLMYSTRIALGSSDTLIGCDMVVAAGIEAMNTAEKTRTHAVINSNFTPTADFTLDTDAQANIGEMKKNITSETKCADFVEATAFSSKIFGDAIWTNMFMLGFAFQRGLIPVRLDSLHQAIELNGVSVTTNVDALSWGRRAAHDITALHDMANKPQKLSKRRVQADELKEIIDLRSKDLIAYQNNAYSARYKTGVQRIQEIERNRAPGMSGLTTAVARSYYKLLAYKDEYEVARLYSDGSFIKKIEEQFSGDFRLRFHLAPPLIARRNKSTGYLVKQEFGSWVLILMSALARLKFLRGTVFDIFGYTAERRAERKLIADYEDILTVISANLNPDNHPLAIKIASIPDDIRGFGHVKDQSIEAATLRQSELLTNFLESTTQVAAAE